MIPREFDLTGRTAVLIGASRGIGRGMADVLAEAGATVALASINIASATAAAEAIKAAGGKAHAFAADATKAGDMQRLAAEVQAALGPIDILVNCVGDSIAKPIVARPDKSEAGMTEAEWHTIVDVNLTQVFTACRAFGPHLLARKRGAVINVSTSLAAFRSGRAAYISAKGGVIAFTEALALEWAPYGVRVNSIAPGSFPDATQLPPEKVAEVRERTARTVPLGRPGTLREAGLLALYLASDASSFVTGQVLCIDGGAGIA